MLVLCIFCLLYTLYKYYCMQATDYRKDLLIKLEEEDEQKPSDEIQLTEMWPEMI